MLDVYVCECDREFLVKDGEEPNCCPFCHSPEIAWSHELNWQQLKEMIFDKTVDDAFAEEDDEDDL